MKSYPLTWPAGWRRIGSDTTARFNKKDRQDNGLMLSRQVSIAEGVKRVLGELQSFAVEEGDSIISTNLKLRLDGLPRSDQQEPKDPGVAVYWQRKKDTQHKVMAIDMYDRVADNLAAIAATLHAMRMIERHGGALILERAFTGFTALPSPNDWRHVLGFENTPTFKEAKTRYTDLAKKRHPDAGGSEAAMKELNVAISTAERELSP